MRRKLGDIIKEDINLYTESSHKLYFPIFQREYAWAPDTADMLLEELYENARLSKKEREEEIIDLDTVITYVMDGKIEYIDGQQRLITLNILMECINERIEKDGLDIAPIKPFDIEYEFYKLQEKYARFFIDKHRRTSPFYSMYQKMKKFVEENKDYLPQLIYTLENKIYVEYKQAKNADIAYTAFIAKNLTNQQMTPKEVIVSTVKNYSEIYGVDIADTDYKILQRTIDSLRTLVQNGDKKAMSELGTMSFLKEYAVKDAVVFKRFAVYTEQVKRNTELAIDAVAGALEKAQLKTAISLLTLKKIDIKEKRAYIDDVLIPLAVLSIIWKVEKTNPGGIAKKLFENVFKAICEDKSPASINKIIIDFISRNKTSFVIRKEDFIEGVDKLNDKSKRALLLLEVILFNRSGCVNVSNVDLEHIIPKNPDSEWIANGLPATDAERDKFINCIGNLILLPGATNKQLSNKYISEKVVAYKDVIERDRILQVPMNTVDLKRIQEAPFDYVPERKKQMVDCFIENYDVARMLIID